MIIRVPIIVGLDRADGIEEHDPFLIVTLALTIFGLVQLYSASYNEALLNGVPHYYYVVRQLQFVGLAAIGSTIIILPSKVLKAFAWPLAVAVLVCCF